MNRASEHGQRSAADSASASSEQRILRMSPDGGARAAIEAILRRQILELAQAIRDKNISRLMTFYAPDVVVFDLQPPLDARGTGAYRRNFERWFGLFEGPIGFEFQELYVAPGEAASFCHYLGHVTGKRVDGRKADYWVRGTTCFERCDGKWLVTHEHISTPMS